MHDTVCDKYKTSQMLAQIHLSNVFYDRLSDATGEMVFKQEKEGGITHSDLDTNVSSQIMMVIRSYSNLGVLKSK